MVLTFGQYSILTAVRQCTTCYQLAAYTNFSQSMVSSIIDGLLKNGLLMIANSYGNSDSYEITAKGFNLAEQYERANPALIIK